MCQFQITDQLKSRFSSGLSLPQLCENLIKAAYDPHISGVYLHIETLNCGWGITDEIRRHILDFKKSGKFIIGYAPVWHEKEYYLGCVCDELYAPPSAYFSLYGFSRGASFYGGKLRHLVPLINKDALLITSNQSSVCKGVFEKVGVEPQVHRIGKYKSFGDMLTRKNISEENREVLTTILDDVYENWVDKVSQAKGKSKEEIESFINEGVYQIEKLKEDGWITDIKYDDEVKSMLKTRLCIAEKKKLPLIEYKKYSRIRKWSVGLSDGKDRIAVIRASGSITRVGGSFFSPSSGIVAEQFIKKISKVRASKRYKAVIIRIDSPGGGHVASDLMWREIKLLAESKPVIASMVDVAASGGYYMAMAANAIVSENLTLTGSIGVVSLNYNSEKLFERIGFNKEVISKGRYAELFTDNRPFRLDDRLYKMIQNCNANFVHYQLYKSLCRPDEEKLVAERAQNIYEHFRDKAACSRSMSVEEMEEIAQGRVWSGKDAASRGLVDAIGGFSRAVAIAKHKANIPHNKQVTLVELSKPSLSIQKILFGMLSSAIGIDKTLKHLQGDFATSDGVQARMDGAMFHGSGGSSSAVPNFSFLKDYIASL
ncbi:putative peptidase S49, ClpP/crotonase-like domain superfamily [Helianthus annuus]|nr:putative peptidase S49, ClpP/crotonase-like domain superfamily [Helianthus annuus]